MLTAALRRAWARAVLILTTRPPARTPRQIRAEIANIVWYHQIDLGHGIITPGVDNTRERISAIRLPDDLSGQDVLDVGAWDGAFSFAAERRGANRVLAVDSFCWNGTGFEKHQDPYEAWGTKDGFNCARRILGSRVEDREVEVVELSPTTVGVFDIVLFLGVLYHMKHPLLALERVASVTRDRLVLETHIDLIELDRPAMAYYPKDELNHDATNWWGPNPLAVEHMLKTVGFHHVERVNHICSDPSNRSQGRAIFHAFRGRRNDRMGATGTGKMTDTRPPLVVQRDLPDSALLRTIPGGSAPRPAGEHGAGRS